MSLLGVEEEMDASGLAISDLMMALVAIFILGSVVMRDAAGKYKDAESLNSDRLDRVIEREIGSATKRHGVELIKGGTIRFRGGFKQGKSKLMPSIKEQLDDVCPSLKSLVIKNHKLIQSVVFEGHTNTDWEALDVNTAYYGNKNVSDKRATNTMRYCLGERFELDHKDLISKFLAVGYSYTRPYKDEKGRIDWGKSKRVDIVIHEKGIRLD